MGLRFPSRHATTSVVSVVSVVSVMSGCDVCLSVCLTVCLSVCPSVRPSVRQRENADKSFRVPCLNSGLQVAQKDNGDTNIVGSPSCSYSLLILFLLLGEWKAPDFPISLTWGPARSTLQGLRAKGLRVKGERQSYKLFKGSQNHKSTNIHLKSAPKMPKSEPNVHQQCSKSALTVWQKKSAPKVPQTCIEFHVLDSLGSSFRIKQGKRPQ